MGNRGFVRRSRRRVCRSRRNSAVHATRNPAATAKIVVASAFFTASTAIAAARAASTVAMTACVLTSSLLLRGQNFRPAARADAAAFTEVGAEVIADRSNHAKGVIADRCAGALFSVNFTVPRGPGPLAARGRYCRS